MAFPAGWTIPPNGRWKADDVDTLRYNALGNAVTPPVASWLAKRIRIYLSAGVNEQVNKLSYLVA